MRDGTEAENRQRSWMQFVSPFGELDIDGLAEARGGVEGIRDLLSSGEIEGDWRNEIESWLTAQEETAVSVWVRRIAEEAEQKRATAAVASMKRSLLMLVFAVVLFLCALVAVVWELAYLPLH